MVKGWVNDLNATSWRITWSVPTACLNVTLLTVSMLWMGWQPTELQLKVLYATGVLLAVMMGLDVAQFGFKRFSDIDYAAAKAKPAVAVASADTVIAPTAPAPAVVDVPASALFARGTVDVPPEPAAVGLHAGEAGD